MFTLSDLEKWDTSALDRWISTTRAVNDEKFMEQLDKTRKHFSDLGVNRGWTGVAYDAAYNRIGQDHEQGRKLHMYIDAMLDAVKPAVATLHSYRGVVLARVGEAREAKLEVTDGFTVKQGKAKVSAGTIQTHQTAIDSARSALTRVISETSDQISRCTGDIRAAGNLIAGSVDVSRAPAQGDRGNADPSNDLRRKRDAQTEFDRLAKLKYMGVRHDPVTGRTVDDALETAKNDLRKWSEVSSNAMYAASYTTSEGRFRNAESYIFGEMHKNVRSGEVATMALLNNPLAGPAPRLGAAVMFKAKVETGAEWDHKPKLESRLNLSSGDDFYFKDPAKNRAISYDIYSNIHYGYVGRAAGFSERELIMGSHMGGSAGVTDDGDDISVRIGSQLYSKYGKDMTQAQLHDGIEQAMREMETALSQGKNVTQIRVTK